MKMQGSVKNVKTGSAEPKVSAALPLTAALSLIYRAVI
jgi:hypothetical protein